MLFRWRAHLPAKHAAILTAPRSHGACAGACGGDGSAGERLVAAADGVRVCSSASRDAPYPPRGEVLRRSRMRGRPGSCGSRQSQSSPLPVGSADHPPPQGGRADRCSDGNSRSRHRRGRAWVGVRAGRRDPRARGRRARRLCARPGAVRHAPAGSRGRGSPSSRCRPRPKARRSRASMGARGSPAQIIWATKFEEVSETEDEGGKGGPQRHDDDLQLLRQFRRRALRGADRADRAHLGGRQAARPGGLHVPRLSRRRGAGGRQPDRREGGGRGAGLSRHGLCRVRAHAARRFRQPHPAALLRGVPPDPRHRGARARGLRDPRLDRVRLRHGGRDAERRARA